MVKRWIFIVAVVVAVVALTSTVIKVVVDKRFVEVRLENTISEKGDRAWEFLIDGKEIPAGTRLRVFEDFPISIKEFFSREIVGEENIGSLIENEDIIAYRYFSSGIDEKEMIFIEIQHRDGTETLVSINID